ncbi:MAG: TonB-dependent receptor plug domain-containing protein [Pseudomonadota bacterium]|nr:TonB-dependent receptor plug domain-containing protein [Pseudomonadota bacterium]
MTPTVLRLALSMALLSLPAIAAGQASAPGEPVTGTKTYAPEDFARYAPRNALDMLEQVPGFRIREALQERGLGQATGNVLINGQRLSGKSDDVISQLSRIPAGNVTRIEIRDGATLDIPGLSGQVANVIAKAGGISGRWEWRPEFRRDFTDPLLTSGEISMSAGRGAFDYSLGLSNGASHSGAGGETVVLNADGSFRERRDDVWTAEYNAPRLSASLGYEGPSAIANLNVAYGLVDYVFEEEGFRSGPGLPDRVRAVDFEESGYNYEVAGDYEFALGSGRLKLIGLESFEHEPIFEQVVTRPLDGSAPATGSRFEQDSEERERIARTEYRWKHGATDWQVSAEAAFNSLDNVSHLFVLDESGNYQPIPLPGSTATVEEDRYEVMGTYGRPVTPRTTVQVALGGEYSRLGQVGGLQRSFVRPKGLFSLAWKPSAALDLTMKLQRRVGQLDFGDFLATVNLRDDRENAANPDLVPQQSWELDLEAIRHLGNYGNTTLRLYGRRIDDIVDTVPIGQTGESPGNLDQATVYGFEWKGTFMLDPIGWKGVKIDTRVQMQESEVRDPLTGEKRPISNSLQEFFELGLRHDIPGTSLAYGGNLEYVFSARDYRLTEVGRRWEGPIWGSLFVEHKDVKGLTLRFTAANLLGATSMWDRTVFEDRRTGPVAYFERRDRTIGPIFAFSVSGKF